jgi:N-glycosylase/DNA lyase
VCSWKLHPTPTDDDADEQYVGVMANIVWLLKQSESFLHYKIVGELAYPSAAINDEGPPSKKKKNKPPVDTSIIVRLKVPEPTTFSSNNNLYPDTYYQQLLNNYFRLDINLENYYEDWIKAHNHFKTMSSQFYAVRMLDQDPVENLISFICSQNNHISR